MYQKQKRYNTAMDRLSDFKIGMWRRNYNGKGLTCLGRPQVAMHSQLPRCLVFDILGLKNMHIVLAALHHILI